MKNKWEYLICLNESEYKKFVDSINATYSYTIPCQGANLDFRDTSYYKFLINILKYNVAKVKIDE